MAQGCGYKLNVCGFDAHSSYEIFNIFISSLSKVVINAVLLPSYQGVEMEILINNNSFPRLGVEPTTVALHSTKPHRYKRRSIVSAIMKNERRNRPFIPLY